MDNEDFKLKHRISQLSAEELLKMIENHDRYRQTALSFAASELTERQIFFTPLPLKPTSVLRKKKLGWRTITLVIGLCGLAYSGSLLYEMLNHPKETKFETFFRLALAMVVVVCILFVRLTTYQSEDDA